MVYEFLFLQGLTIFKLLLKVFQSFIYFNYQHFLSLSPFFLFFSMLQSLPLVFTQLIYPVFSLLLFSLLFLYFKFLQFSKHQTQNYRFKARKQQIVMLIFHKLSLCILDHKFRQNIKNFVNCQILFRHLIQEIRLFLLKGLQQRFRVIF